MKDIFKLSFDQRMLLLNSYLQQNKILKEKTNFFFLFTFIFIELLFLKIFHITLLDTILIVNILQSYRTQNFSLTWR